jgi:hypothetical protein
VPKFEKLMHDGIIDPAVLDEAGASWMPAFVKGVKVAGGEYTIWWILVPTVAWGLFEWRVRSENKAFMRLSALGTAAVGLMVVVVVAAGSLVIPFCLAAPATGQLVRPFALEQLGKIDTSVSALEQAMAKKDWDATQEHADQASHAVDYLVRTAPAIPSLASWREPALGELRAQVKATNESLEEAQQAIQAKDAGRLEAALKKFHEAYGPIRAAATKAVK